MVNQERVWKQEKKALEERKKLEELKRERDQEREMQDLQRLQEVAGGRKRQEKVDWMYATPSTSGGPSASEMEDYLLGKKRVDKLLKGDESQQLSKNSGQESFMALQNANTSKDLATKVREDPLLAIKKQEQAAYEALLKDPTRLRELRKAHGLDDGEDKEAKRRRKEEKRRAKEERRTGGHHHGSGSSHRRESQRSRSRSRSYSPDARRRRDERSSRRDYDERPRSSYQDHDDRRPPRRHEEEDRRAPGYDRRYDGYERRDHPRSNGDAARGYPDRQQPDRSHERRYDEPPRQLPRRDQGVVSSDTTSRNGASGEDAAAKLARMAASAQAVQADRTATLSRVEAEDAAELAREEALREQVKKRYGKLAGGETMRGDFLLNQQRQLTMGSNMDLAERLGRGKAGLQKVDAD